jgi:hypothetical protein
VAGISQTIIVLNDRALQQRVLLRDLTAFPFHHANGATPLKHYKDRSILIDAV